MIKVNVISGFLGAGKTTLIKHLAAALAENNEKVVILENEFGKIGIDGKVLELEGLSVYEISSGCICCTLKNDFITTLINIADDICPDRILIEPSGIFVLSEMHDIFKNPQIKAKLTLCSVLTVIDCVNFLKQRQHYGYFFENQINYADMLILSKIADIREDSLVSIIEELQSINPRVDVLSGEWAFMDKSNLLRLLEVGKHDTISKHSKPKVSLRKNEVNNTHNKHGKHNFMAFSLTPQTKFNKTELIKKLSSLQYGNFGTLLRVKGHVLSENGMLGINFVNGTYEIIKIAQEIEPSVCFIGEDLDKESLSALLAE